MAKSRYAKVDEEPRFTNGCDACRFLGRFDDVDCYVCNEGYNCAELVVRYSADSLDSGLLSELRAAREHPEAGRPVSALHRAYEHFFMGAAPGEDKCACGARKVHGYDKGHPGHSDYCPWRKR